MSYALIGMRTFISGRDLTACLECGYAVERDSLDNHGRCDFCRDGSDVVLCWFCGDGVPRESLDEYGRCDQCREEEASGSRVAYPDLWGVLLQAQSAGCAICGETHKLLLDHDHRTGLIRGLLCPHCNVHLGAYHDSSRLLRSNGYKDCAEYVANPICRELGILLSYKDYSIWKSGRQQKDYSHRKPAQDAPERVAGSDSRNQPRTLSDALDGEIAP